MSAMMNEEFLKKAFKGIFQNIGPIFRSRDIYSESQANVNIQGDQKRRKQNKCLLHS